eukprot:1159770-Pelagomonas_calceolata.AAC.13
MENTLCQREACKHSNKPNNAGRCFSSTGFTHAKEVDHFYRAMAVFYAKNRRVKKTVVDTMSKLWTGAPKGPPTPLPPRILPPSPRKGHQSAPFSIPHPSAYSAQ